MMQAGKRVKGESFTPSFGAQGSGAPVNARWTPAPAVWFSLLWHVLCIAIMVVRPEMWPWAVVALICNHIVLSAAVCWPRGSLLGPNIVCLPAPAVARGQVCLTFDDGPDPVVTPQVLDLMDRYEAKASFFCIGHKAALYPEIVKEIARRGHSVENHSQSHPNAFAFYGWSRLRREVETAQMVLAGITGSAPRYFRAPMGFRSPLLDPILGRRGLRYVSWTRRGYDAVNRDPVRVTALLAQGLGAGDVLLLHDGAGARTHDGRPVVLLVLPALLEALAARGLRSVSLPAAFDH
jgi:peptidoglycan-N-acetylglucosamine deacetylase